MLRALALLGLIGLAVLLFFVTYFAFGEVVIAWFWFLFGTAKVWLYYIVMVLVPATFAWIKVWLWYLVERLVAAAPGWLKLMLVNFFKVEILKKWMITVAIPLLIGIKNRQSLKRFLRRLRTRVELRRRYLMLRYRALSPVWRLVLGVGVVGAILVLSLFVWWFGFLLFLVKIPAWISGPLWYLWSFFTLAIQKAVFQIVVFLHLDRLWRRLKSFLPQRIIRRWRAANYRALRMAIKRRNLTADQLKVKKQKLTLRLSLRKERNRNRAEETADTTTPEPGPSPAE